MKIHNLFVFLLFFSGSLFAGHGRFVDPISDVCWSCIFPITLGTIELNSNEPKTIENEGPSDEFFCFCPRPPLPVVPGIPVGFWEPARLIDVTREAFNLVSLGGLKIGPSSITYGSHGIRGDKKKCAETAFYHVHLYVYPLLYWLELLSDFVCVEQASFDVAWLSELDPSWNDDELNFILNPEVALLSNPIAQLSCIGDCIASTAGNPIDSMPWCAGCQGSMYPFSGTVYNHVGGVQSSFLLAQRLVAKMHRVLLMWETSGKRSLCRKTLRPVVKKSQYRLQMVYPIAATKKIVGCMPFGRNTFLLEASREFPVKGEDFAYLLWRKRDCCLL